LQTELERTEQRRVDLQAMAPELAAYHKARKEKERLDKAKGVFEEREGLVHETRRLESDIKAKAADLTEKAKALTRYAGVEAKLRRTSTAIQTAEKKLKKIEGGLKKAQSALDRETGLLEQLTDNANQLRTEGPSGECPTCLRPLGENFAEIMEHFRQERKERQDLCSQLRKQVNGLSENKRNLEVELQGRRTERDRLLGQDRKRRVQSAKLGENRKTVKALEATLGRKQNRLAILSKTRYDTEAHRHVEAALRTLTSTYEQSIKLKRDIGRIPGLRSRLKKTEVRIDRVQAEMTEAESRLKQLGFKQESYDQAKSAHDSATAELRRREAKAAEIRAALAVLDDRHKRLEKEVREKQALKKQIADEEESIRYLSQLEYVLKDFQADLISQIRPLITQRASVLLDQVTEGRYSQIELDEDYAISIIDDGTSYPIQRFSGGEEDLTNLCLRVAISQVIAEQISGEGSGIIALDEVFGSQDRERRERLIRALQNLTPTFRQILFITHIEDLQERVPNILHVWEDVDHSAVVQWLN
jgi:DNA repair protein SbcC/Rad50